MRTEKILGAIIWIGILFKLLHWPGGGIILVLSLSALAMIYFSLAFYFYADGEIKNQNLPLSIATGLFLSIIPIGILFKLQYWPGATFYLLMGSVGSFILFPIIYFMQKRNMALTTYYKNMMKRVIVLGTASFILYITPITTLLNIQYWNDPELAEIAARSYQNPENEEYRKQLEEYRNNKYPAGK